MRKLLLVLLAGTAVYFTYKIVDSVKNKPAQGLVEVEVMDMPTEDVLGPVEVSEEPVMGPMEEPMMEEVVETPVVEEFMPLSFTGKGIKKFAEANGGMVLDVRVDARAEELGGKKGVKVGADIYFKGKDGNYVFHNGEVIKL